MSNAETYPQTGDASPEKQRSMLLQWLGRLGAPALALLVHASLPQGPDGLTDPGRATLSIAVLLALLWMTEALPLPVTSLLPIVLFPLASIADVREATAPYANEVIFLFMGGFMLALAMERWGLHRRIALLILAHVGTRPTHIIGGFMLASAFLSMWISNTATAVMMLPIGVSLSRLVLERTAGSSASAWSEFSPTLMLSIAYAASIGSLGTLIGTPPNLLLRGFVQRAYGIEIGFAQWMLLGVPLAVLFLAVAWWTLTRRIRAADLGEIPGGADIVRRELAELGTIRRGELTVLVIFVTTAAAWVAREPVASIDAVVRAAPWVARITDAGIAVAAAVTLFMVPVHARSGVFVLDWPTAERLPWGVLLLFGGGLSLANALQMTGVDLWLGSRLGIFAALPLVIVVLAIVTSVIFLTELTSNTAVAATLLPILGGIAISNGIEPLLLLVPATLAASCAFMMPVGTPPNAIVFGSGQVTMARMVRAGLALNLIGIVIITAFAFTLGRAVLGSGD